MRIFYRTSFHSLLIFIVGWLSCCTHASTNTPIEDSSYVGTQSCSACHQQEFQDWNGSHHDLAMQEANDSTVLGDFNNVVFSNKGITSRFFRKGSAFIVHTEGPTGAMEDFEIAYTFGVFPLQQYLVKFPGGRFQALHLAWDSRQKKWFDLQPTERHRPDDWMHWTKGSMTWNNMCADCHSTNLQKNYDSASDTYNTNWSIIDVSCEACHGPGSTHVEYVQSKSYLKGKRTTGSYLYQTSNLNNTQQVESCARCHSLRSNQSLAYSHTGTYMDHYVPEIPQPPLYQPDGQIIEEVYVYGSFTQSRMYHQGVKCTNCHNPHSLRLKAEGNALCTQCHTAATYDAVTHHFHPQGSPGAQCVNCHMPGKYYMVNDFRRDHSLRVPRPDLSQKYGVPNACNDCHSKEGYAWQAEAVKAHFGPKRKPHYSEAFTAFYNGEAGASQRVAQLIGDTSQNATVQAMAVRYLSDADARGWERIMQEALKHSNALVRYAAVRAFQQYPQELKSRALPALLQDPVRSVRAQAAYILTGLQNTIPTAQRSAYERALAEYETVLQAQSDFTGGRLMAGQHRMHQGNAQAAEKAFKSAIAMDQDHAPAINALASFYYSQNRFRDAELTYKRYLERNPKEAWAWYDLGLLLAEMQRLPEAAGVLERAAVSSGDPRHYYNWGLVLQNLGNNSAAEKAFLNGLKKDSNASFVRYALAVLYYQQGNVTKSKEMVRMLLKQEPQNSQFQQLAQALGM